MIKTTAHLGHGKKYDSTKRDWSDFGLDYTPFMGTLNVRLHRELSEKEFHSLGEVRQAFPDFVCIKGKINNEPVDLCYSKLRGHNEITTVYAISDKPLRQTLGLKDTEDVEIQLGGFR
jgi:CTP-dependent riboflavin kinase